MCTFHQEVKQPKYLVVLKASFPGGMTVAITDNRDIICKLITKTTGKPIMVGEWWLDYLVKEEDQHMAGLVWVPIGLAAHQVSETIPKDLARILVKHL